MKGNLNFWGSHGVKGYSEYLKWRLEITDLGDWITELRELKYSKISIRGIYLHRANNFTRVEGNQKILKIQTTVTLEGYELGKKDLSPNYNTSSHIRDTPRKRRGRDLSYIRRELLIHKELKTYIHVKRS